MEPATPFRMVPVPPVWRVTAALPALIVLDNVILPANTSPPTVPLYTPAPAEFPAALTCGVVIVNELADSIVTAPSVPAELDVLIAPLTVTPLPIMKTDPDCFPAVLAVVVIGPEVTANPLEIRLTLPPLLAEEPVFMVRFDALRKQLAHAASALMA
jgi:hypothetical protein